MQQDQLTPEHVLRAIELYLELAWPKAEYGAARCSVDFGPLRRAASLEDLLGCFERRPHAQRSDLRHYALRMGNGRYPFMKFVVQEYLESGQLFFSVDTHDNLSLDRRAPDYDRWLELKVFNRGLKQEIESAWLEQGLPTNADIQRLADRILVREAGVPNTDADRASEGTCRGRVLLVDDERDVAKGVCKLLESRGFDVELAYDGEQVLARLAKGNLPDLVVLDHDMPGANGEQVLAQLRSEQRTADLPVLMATASNIDLARLQRISGFLRKPYTFGLLVRMIDELLEPK